MKLKSIKIIKWYKSYHNFSWDNFLNTQEFHDTANIFYGENGAGKSSIVNILKNVLQWSDITTNFPMFEKNFGYKSFGKHIPEKVSLEFDIWEYNYDWSQKYSTINEIVWISWDKKLENNNSILFFDRDFIANHIHADIEWRKTNKDGHEQNSGTLIIQFDSVAIEKRKLRDKLKRQISKSDDGNTCFDRLEKFKEDNKDTLNFSLSQEEELLFNIYKEKSKEEITKLTKEFSKEEKDIQQKVDADKESQKKVDDIQNLVLEISNKKIKLSVSEQSIYQDLFSFDLKEQVKIKAEEKLITKIKQHKNFFETGIAIRKEHESECPFCQSKNQEGNIGKIIWAYNSIFDDTYKKQFQTFENNQKILIEELEDIINTAKNYDLESVFISLSELNEKYKIKNIYSVEEQKKYKKWATDKINDLKEKIKHLKKPNNDDIEKTYINMQVQVEWLQTFFNNIYNYIDEKNTLIQNFKINNTNDKINNRIAENTQKIKDIKSKITFFNEGRINKQKEKEIKNEAYAVIQKEFDEIKIDYNNVKEDYQEYCSEEVFKKTLKKIEGYFDKFKFSFKLKLKTEKTWNKTEFPFAFQVLDNWGNERDFKEGLSEWELQVLSLCFFFAFLDIQTNPENKILVFDDPITSLDNNNLSHLVDLISEKHTQFSQTFIFTHHRTFFKFLRLKYNLVKKPEKKGHEYYIFRNNKDFGGSFICPRKVDNLNQKLKNFEKTILYNAQNGGIEENLLVIEYWQYLRYEIENYIKNDLLHVNKPNFWNIIDSLVEDKENNKDITVEELKKIKEIYSFCNWTTSHVDVGDEHGLEQLKEKINDFIKITS